MSDWEELHDTIRGLEEQLRQSDEAKDRLAERVLHLRSENNDLKSRLRLASENFLRSVAEVQRQIREQSNESKVQS